jgi:ABC-type multidrug transport system ATPase subunit
VEFHKPVRLWSKLIYGVTRRLPSGDGMRRRLLHNVSGTVRPGQFMAIMGPEGASALTQTPC